MSDASDRWCLDFCSCGYVHRPLNAHDEDCHARVLAAALDEEYQRGRRAGLEEAAGVCRQFYDDPNRPRDSSVLGYLAGNLRDRAKEPAPVCAKCAADVRVTPGTCECPIPVREGRGRGVATVRAPAPCAKCGEPWERHTLTLPAGAVGRYDVPCPVKPAPSGGKGEP
jgi:hypothetical protein